MLGEHYRKDYTGEFVVVNTRWTNGRKEQDREWIPRQLENNHLSGRAAVIGEGSSRADFRLSALETHRGGLLAKKRLQTYAVDTAYREIRADFLVVSTEPLLHDVIAAGYHETTPVYSNTMICLRNPGTCYMIPMNYRAHPVAEACYLAAFDGHREVFLLGCDRGEATFAKQVAEVFGVYKTVSFTVVTDTTTMPDQWRYYPNVRKWTYREFITGCDI